MKKKLKTENFLNELYSIINQRVKSRRKNSYTNFILQAGPKKLAQKISEESSELVIELLKGSNKRIVEETADLIYHILLLLYSKKITIKKIENELKKRNRIKNV